MIRKAYVFTAIGIGCLSAGAAVLAQSARVENYARPSLSDRIQGFRRTLFDGPEDPSPRETEARRPGALPRYTPAPSQPPGSGRSAVYGARQPASTPNSMRRPADDSYQIQSSPRLANRPQAHSTTGAGGADGEVAISEASRQSSRRTAQRDYANEFDELDAPSEPADDFSDEYAASQSSSARRPAPRQRISVAQRTNQSDEVPIGPTAETVDVENVAPEKNVQPAAEPSHAASSSNSVLFERGGPSLAVGTSGPRSVTVGKDAPYKITLVNDGSAPAESVVVTVKIPDSAELAATKSTAGTTSPVNGEAGSLSVQWAIPHLATGSREELTLGIIARKSRPLDLAVQWTHAPITSRTVVEVKEPKLEMTISGPEEVFYGESAKYRLTLSNPGTGDAEDVTVRLLPTAAGETQAEGHRIGTIRAGDTKAVDLELTARQAGLVVIRAEAVADSGLRATVAEEVLVRRAALDVTLEGPALQYAGTTATYEVRVSNPGNAVAKNVRIAAITPSGAKFADASAGGRVSADGGKVEWNFDNVQPGSDQVLWVKWSLNTPGANRPQVTAVGDGDLSDSSTLVTEVEAIADLVLDVRDPRVPVPVGEAVTYEIRLSNRGTKAADSVEVFAFFSDGVEPVGVEGGSHRIAPGQVVFDPIKAIAPGQEIVLKIKAAARRSGNHVFRAEARSRPLDISLATEETTRFYDGARVGSRIEGTSSQTRPQAPGVLPADDGFADEMDAIDILP